MPHLVNKMHLNSSFLNSASSDDINNDRDDDTRIKETNSIWKENKRSEQVVLKAKLKKNVRKMPPILDKLISVNDSNIGDRGGKRNL